MYATVLSRTSVHVFRLIYDFHRHPSLDYHLLAVIVHTLADGIRNLALVDAGAQGGHWE